MLAFFLDFATNNFQLDLYMTLVLLNIIRLPDDRYSGSEMNLSSETSPWRYNSSLDWSRTGNGNLAMRSSGNG